MFFWDKHKTITDCYELLAKGVCEKYKLTQMEYDILMFLHNSPQHNTAAEIVKVRKSTKSHVSTSLKKLEEKGFIKRIQSADNKKHIEIIMLDASIPVLNDGLKPQKEFAKRCGVCVSTVIAWESGKRYPNAKMLGKIERALGISINFLRFE